MTIRWQPILYVIALFVLIDPPLKSMDNIPLERKDDREIKLERALNLPNLKTVPKKLNLHDSLNNLRQLIKNPKTSPEIYDNYGKLANALHGLDGMIKKQNDITVTQPKANEIKGLIDALEKLKKGEAQPVDPQAFAKAVVEKLENPKKVLSQPVNSKAKHLNKSEWLQLLKNKQYAANLTVTYRFTVKQTNLGDNFKGYIAVYELKDDKGEQFKYEGRPIHITVTSINDEEIDFHITREEDYTSDANKNIRYIGNIAKKTANFKGMPNPNSMQLSREGWGFMEKIAQSFTASYATFITELREANAIDKHPR